MALEHRKELRMDATTAAELADLQRWSTGPSVPTASDIIRALIHKAWLEEHERQAGKTRPKRRT